MRRIISPRRLRDYAAAHPDAQRTLDRWERVVNEAQWASPADLKQTFNDVDPVLVRSGRTVYIFNIICAHRLIAAIHFNTGMVFVLRILDHKEYDRALWKEEL